MSGMRRFFTVGLKLGRNEGENQPALAASMSLFSQKKPDFSREHERVFCILAPIAGQAKQLQIASIVRAATAYRPDVINFHARASE
jgi:hypothetical protein